MTNLGKYNIKCYLPFSRYMKVGVIGPIGLETSEEEMTEYLQESGYHNARATRLLTGPGKDKKKTLTMKIYLEAEELPSHIELMSERFKVSQFFEKPWQCYKCQKFGHNANACSGETKCVFCSGNHRVR